MEEDEWTRTEGGGEEPGPFIPDSSWKRGDQLFGCARHGTPTHRHPKPTRVSRAYPFHAMGVSVVFHPDNPHAPTSHANVRYFEASPPGKEKVWWFGGGFDLTPTILLKKMLSHGTERLKKTCDQVAEDQYTHFKKWCDEYFYLRHRKETRGVGGFFSTIIGKEDSISPWTSQSK